MDWFAINLFVLVVGIQLLIGLPLYFKKKNVRVAVQQQFDAYVKEMLEQDKIYMPHMRQLNKNLNTINFWLKTGKDPAENEEDAEVVAKEDRFFAGLMDPLEAKKWRAAVKKAKEDNSIDEDIKSIRVPEFHVKGMEPLEVGQADMKFKYATDSGEYIYYCVNPEFAAKKCYRQLIYFTTARPTNIPVVFPHKYEGAQMLSLYKHPAQTVWFLKNWKLIREGLEGAGVEEVPLDEDVTEFDL